jgi:hypothetical protein
MNPLLWPFNLILGCWHRHKSRVFTIKNRTYRVCLDCGLEFELPDAHTPARFDIVDRATSPIDTRRARLKQLRSISDSVPAIEP